MKKKKKGFTLIELIFVTVLMTIISALGVKAYLDKKENDGLQKLINNIDYITATYVLNTNVGYADGSGDYCSDDNTVNKVDAYRAINCIDLVDKPFSVYKANSGKDTHDKCAYIEVNSTVVNFDNDKSPCRLHYDYADSGNILYIQANCSALKGDRKRKLFEELLNNSIKSNFASTYDKTYPDWKISNEGTTHCSSNNTDGNDSDGEIAFKLKLN